MFKLKFIIFLTIIILLKQFVIASAFSNPNISFNIYSDDKKIITLNDSLNLNNINVSATISNQTSNLITYNNLNLFIASYNPQNKLLNVIHKKYSDIKIQPYDAYIINNSFTLQNLLIPSNPDGYKVKIFLQNEFLNPLGSYTLQYILQDTEPPAWENSQIFISNITNTEAMLVYTPAKDIIEPVEYKIFNNNSLIATTNANEYTLTGLLPSSGYTVSVIAVDIFKNESVAKKISFKTASERFFGEMSGYYLMGYDNLAVLPTSAYAINSRYAGTENCNNIKEYAQTFAKNILISRDGTIYGNYNNKLLAFNQDGSVKWEYIADNKIEGAIIKAEDETIYTISNFGGNTANSTIYAINKDGTEKWKKSFTTEAYAYSRPINNLVISENGDIVFSTYNDLLCFGKDGEQKLQYKDLSIALIENIQISKNKKIFVSAASKTYILNTDFSLITTLILSSPIIGNDCVLYGTYNKSFKAYNTETLKVLWTVDLGISNLKTSCIDNNNNVIVYSDNPLNTNDSWFLIDKLGTVLEAHNEKLISKGVIDSENKLYCGNGMYEKTNNVYVKKWNMPVSTTLQPTIHSNGKILIISENKLYEIGGN